VPGQRNRPRVRARQRTDSIAYALRWNWNTPKSIHRVDPRAVLPIASTTVTAPHSAPHIVHARRPSRSMSTAIAIAITPTPIEMKTSWRNEKKLLSPGMSSRVAMSTIRRPKTVIAATASTSTQSRGSPGSGGANTRSPAFANSPIGVAFPSRGLNHQALTRAPVMTDVLTRKGLPTGA